MEENRVKYAVERFKEELSVLNKTIWEAAEIKYEEYRSEAAVIEVLRKHGFRLEEQVADIPTAFRAVYGSGRPVIGLLAEYDALDGLSQQADCLEKKPRPETRYGHGCGHNLLGTAVVAAALDLKDYLEKHPGRGTVIVYGMPGEEGGTERRSWREPESLMRSMRPSPGIHARSMRRWAVPCWQTVRRISGFTEKAVMREIPRKKDAAHWMLWNSWMSESISFGNTWR